MPKEDIRSYFTSKTNNALKASPTSSKPKPRKRVISSDEEESKEKTPQKRTKVREKKKRSAFLSDSDDDVQVVQVKKKDEKASKVEKKIAPKDVFGNASIKRVAAPKIIKKTPVPTKQTLSKTESAFHDDEEFERTLEQLDASVFEEAYVTTATNIANGDSKSDKKSKEKPEPESKKIVTSSDKKRKLDDDKEKNKKPKPEKSPSKKKEETVKKQKKKEASSVKIEFEKKESPKKKADKEEEKAPKNDPYQERIEMKKQSAALYQQYLTRGGARNPGSKEIPEGAEYCLAGLSFVITGVLDSLERDEATELITKYGGRIVMSVSKKTNYVIVGDQPGQSKLSKADSLGVKTISENDLLDLVRNRPAGKAYEVVTSGRGKGKAAKTEEAPKKSPSKNKTASKEKPSTSTSSSSKDKTANEAKPSTSTSSPKPTKKETSEPMITENQTPTSVNSETLVDKYRPKTMKQLIGQQGDKSNAQKLKKWLSNWHKNRGSDVKHAKPSPWAKNDDGGFFKAALLSGPPGVGKTTTVQVVCNELGLDLIEFNASDTRSKRLLQESVSSLLSNKTMKGFVTSDKKGVKPSTNHVLVMDEIDGMAGNEDRGGLQEMIALIKSTSVPIVCICNDRANPKMKTLSNYTFDLKFSKPRLEQIKAAMKTICFREGIKISDEDLMRLIESTDQDVRQVINHLAMHSASAVIETNNPALKAMHKDLKLGPWEATRKVFSSEEHKKMSIYDRSDLFFHDYSISPLFVHENYLSVTPNAPRSELLKRVASTAESLAMGDMIENKIRKDSAWSLLPTQAFFSSVIPGFQMSGRINAAINFPSWLGRNSKTGKFKRLLQELSSHTRMATGVSKEAIALDYVKPLRDKIVRPLVTKGSEGIEEAVEAMNKYHLVREDLDSLTEVSLWPGDKDPMQGLSTKVKTAFTKSYNKNSAAYAYSAGGVAKKKSKKEIQDEGFIEGEIEDSESEKDDAVDNDKMIKAKIHKKPEASKAAAESKPSKKGKGRGKAK